MLRRSEIEFKSGSILRKEMLQDIYEYPRIAVESLFSDFSDGILYGMTWKENDGKHPVICPGAIKLHGNIYFLKQELDVEKELENALNINGSYRLCFVIQEAEKQIEAKTDYYLKLAALQDQEYERVENSSFWYAYITYSGEKKIEIITGANAIKYGISGLNATDDGYGFQLPNWVIKQQIFPELEKKNNKHPLDYYLLKEIYAGKPVSLSFINVYLNELGREKIAYSCSPCSVVEQLKQAVKDLTFTISVEVTQNQDTVKNEESWRGGSI